MWEDHPGLIKAAWKIELSTADAWPAHAAHIERDPERMSFKRMK